MARERFSDDERAEALQRLGSRLSQSRWHAQLSSLAASAPAEAREAYLIHPFRIYRTFRPYLVGSHAEVAELLRGYHARGLRTVVLDSPRDPDDLAHAAEAVELVARSL